MSSSNRYLVVSVYPNCRIRNSDNEVTFECENLILLRIQPSLILGGIDGSGRKEIGRVGYRLLNHGGARDEDFCGVGDVSGSGFESSDFVQDDPTLAPPPIHVASTVEDIEVDGEDSDEEYVVDSNKSGSSEDDDDDEEEFVPYPSIEASRREVRRVGGAHTCLVPTMLQDHRQLDISLICRVILPLIQSNPFVSISLLQGAVRQSYHFKPSCWSLLYCVMPINLWTFATLTTIQSICLNNVMRKMKNSKTKLNSYLAAIRNM
ncbi:hypothetical protein Ahy_B07g088501 [Arachis hypogaea]|uniref:Uncharacterized protein n=1 Tax=Arachis hypogaea TaxID=3818 RepID=A0A444YEL0_ARAHY|nr:hypothetical protein Ahy_B07g088501 [Arachis hypogaea]